MALFPARIKRFGVHKDAALVELQATDFALLKPTQTHSSVSQISSDVKIRVIIVKAWTKRGDDRRKQGRRRWRSWRWFGGRRARRKTRRRRREWRRWRRGRRIMSVGVVGVGTVRMGMVRVWSVRMWSMRVRLVSVRMV